LKALRLARVALLVNLALGVGFYGGFLWREWEIGRLTRERDGLKQALAVRQGEERTWSARGIVRGVSPQASEVLITHEPIPGLMGSMTMSFRAADPTLARNLAPGDVVQFTLLKTGDELVLVSLRKEPNP
jgi:Cu/Ag efflux protein CusF